MSTFPILNPSGPRSAQNARQVQVQRYIAANWNPHPPRPMERGRRGAASRGGDAPFRNTRGASTRRDPVRASLMEMPAEIIANILGCQAHFGPNSDCCGDELSSLLALAQTCRAFHDLLRNDEIWTKMFPGLTRERHDIRALTCRESVFRSRALHNVRSWQESTDNIVLEYLEGAQGVRRFAGLFLQRAFPTAPHETVPDCDAGCTVGDWSERVSIENSELRGDTIYYLTELIQGHMLEKLVKVNLMVNENHDRDDRYPEITTKDLRLLDVLLSDQVDSFQCSCEYKNTDIWSFKRARGGVSRLKANDLESEEFLGSDKRFKMARALAYRAGIVKMSEESFSLVALEILHRMATLLHDACIASHSVASSGPALRHGERIPYRSPFDVFANQPPPLQHSGDGHSFYSIIVPRQIKDAALRSGMKPLMGFGQFGLEWAPICTEEDTQADEVMISTSQYNLDTSGSEDDFSDY